MMLVGRFHRHFPRLALNLMTRNGEYRSVEFIVDTGFDGFLALPAEIARQIAITSFGNELHMLADGSHVECPVGSATLDWDGADREVEVIVMGANPLIGTLLIDGSQLTIDLNEEGEVTVEIQD